MSERWHTTRTDGESMWPLLRGGEWLRYREAEGPPRPGEVWVFQADVGTVAHRVLWVRGGEVLLKGDHRLTTDGWVPVGALLGRAELAGEPGRGGQEGRWRPLGRRRDRLLGLAVNVAQTMSLGARWWVARLRGKV